MKLELKKQHVKADVV